MNSNYDVIIGGAGPVGLFLACELGLSGVSVLVIEREAEISTPWTTNPLGFRGLNVASVEAFYRRGLLNELFDADSTRPMYFHKTTENSVRFAGHYAGIMLDAHKVDMSRWKYRLLGPSFTGGRTNLELVARVLSERAENYDVTILRGLAITDVSHDSASVAVRAGDQVFAAKYLVGCDGGRSTIRKQAGFEFVGTDAEFTGYTAHCELDDPEKIQTGFQITPTGMYIMPTSGHVIVMDFGGEMIDRTKVITVEDFQRKLQYVSGTDVKVKQIFNASTFTDRALQATTYRKDRIFLAGDSAHIHSPLGGQGLNAGIGDAINLGWKLAAMVRGRAPKNLLDTYTEERHPIAAAVLEWSRAQVSILKPTPEAKASYKVMKALLDTVDGTNYCANRVWGLSQRYDLGDDHELVGASAPDFEFVDGTRLGKKMESGKGLLIDFTNNSALKEIVREWDAEIDYIDGEVKDQLGLSALLVRPDGIVAWLAQGQPDLSGLNNALESWFGAGTVAVHA